MERTAPVRKIFVSLGTHEYPFPALVERLIQVVPDGVDITWQLGSTPAPAGLQGRVHRTLDAQAQDTALRTADVVVGHAGTGLLLSSLEAGRMPVLVPRQVARNEHVDDHQRVIADEFARRRLARVATPDRLSWSFMASAAEQRVVPRTPEPFRLHEHTSG